MLHSVRVKSLIKKLAESIRDTKVSSLYTTYLRIPISPSGNPRQSAARNVSVCNVKNTNDNRSLAHGTDIILSVVMYRILNRLP